jgi:hypothetical protein
MIPDLMSEILVEFPLGNRRSMSLFNDVGKHRLVSLLDVKLYDKNSSSLSLPHEGEEANASTILQILEEAEELWRVALKALLLSLMWPQIL